MEYVHIFVAWLHYTQGPCINNVNTKGGGGCIKYVTNVNKQGGRGVKSMLTLARVIRVGIVKLNFSDKICFPGGNLLGFF